MDETITTPTPEQPIKRGRGRPRKHPLPPTPPVISGEMREVVLGNSPTLPEKDIKSIGEYENKLIEDWVTGEEIEDPSRVPASGDDVPVPDEPVEMPADVFDDLERMTPNPLFIDRADSWPKVMLDMHWAKFSKPDPSKLCIILDSLELATKGFVKYGGHLLPNVDPRADQKVRALIGYVTSGKGHRAVTLVNPWVEESLAGTGEEAVAMVRPGGIPQQPDRVTGRMVDTPYVVGIMVGSHKDESDTEEFVELHERDILILHPDVRVRLVPQE